MTQRVPAELLTVARAAQQAGVSPWTINRWVRRSSRRIRPADLATTLATVHSGEVVPTWRRDPQRTGMRLRALREAAGLTQIELAAAIGVAHEHISRLELGQRSPQAEAVRVLA